MSSVHHTTATTTTTTIGDSNNHQVLTLLEDTTSCSSSSSTNIDATPTSDKDNVMTEEEEQNIQKYLNKLPEESSPDLSLTAASKRVPRLGPFLLLKTLGVGEFGKVKMGRHFETGHIVAVKLVKKENIDSSSQLDKIRMEIDILKTLNHPYIVKLLSVNETNTCIGMVLEYAQGGELFEYIYKQRHLKENEAKRLFSQLISSVYYMHQKNIVHRDLKLENILLDRHGNLIVTDFGFSNQFTQKTGDLMSTSCGSPVYAAPELVMTGRLYAGTGVDIWSCGIILYAMLCGYLPFDDDAKNPNGDNIGRLYRYIIANKPKYPYHLSLDAKDMIGNMLIPDPSARCKIETIMIHPWLHKYKNQLSKSIEELEEEAHVLKQDLLAAIECKSLVQEEDYVEDVCCDDDNIDVDDDDDHASCSTSTSSVSSSYSFPPNSYNSTKERVVVIEEKKENDEQQLLLHQQEKQENNGDDVTNKAILHQQQQEVTTTPTTPNTTKTSSSPPSTPIPYSISTTIEEFPTTEKLVVSPISHASGGSSRSTNQQQILSEEDEKSNMLPDNTDTTEKVEPNNKPIIIIPVNALSSSSSSSSGNSCRSAASSHKQKQESPLEEQAVAATASSNKIQQSIPSSSSISSSTNIVVASPKKSKRHTIDTIFTTKNFAGAITKEEAEVEQDITTTKPPLITHHSSSLRAKLFSTVKRRNLSASVVQKSDVVEQGRLNKDTKHRHSWQNLIHRHHSQDLAPSLSPTPPASPVTPERSKSVRLLTWIKSHSSHHPHNNKSSSKVNHSTSESSISEEPNYFNHYKEEQDATIPVVRPSSSLAAMRSSNSPVSQSPSSLLQHQQKSIDRLSIESELRIHQGDMNRSALTSKPPMEVLLEINKILLILGIEVKNQGGYKLLCVRRSTFHHHTQNQLQNEDMMNHLSTSHQPVFSQPIFGHPAIDNGDEVFFSVEICRFENLSGLFSVDIKCLSDTGNFSGYQFIGQKLLALLHMEGAIRNTNFNVMLSNK